MLSQITTNLQNFFISILSFLLFLLYKICFLKVCCLCYLFELIAELENGGAYSLKLSSKALQKIFSKYIENLVVYQYIENFYYFPS